MKHFFFKILLFSIILIAFLGFWNWRIDNNIYNHEERKYEELYANTKNANAIIMGTSHLLNSLNPKYLDNDVYSFYNYSFPGAGPKFFYNWFSKIYLKNNKEPEFIIYELHWFLFDKPKLYRKLEHDSEFLNYNDYFNLLFDKNHNFKLTLKNRFGLIKYNDFSNFKNLIVKKTDYTPFPIELINDGFVPCELSESHKKKNFGNNLIKYSIDSVEKEYFEKLINLFLSKSIKLLFLSSPEYGADPNKYKKLEVNQYLDSFAKKLNIPYMNYNIELYSGEYQNLDMFSDWNHTNSKGAEKFSVEFRNDLDSMLIY